MLDALRQRPNKSDDARLRKGTDSVAVYLREVAKYRRSLTPEEERALASTIQATEPRRQRCLRELKEIYASLRGKQPSREQSTKIEALQREIRTIEDDPERRKAIHTFIVANLLLVVSRAKIFSGQPFADRIQTGNLGLYKAVLHFQSDKGAKFSTYAVHWIDHYIRREEDNMSSTVRFSVHRRVQLRRFRQIRNGLYIRLGRQPSLEEIAIEWTQQRETKRRKKAENP